MSGTRVAKTQIDRGLMLAGVRIHGELNLSYGTVAAPITFKDCIFDQPVTMVGSTITALALPQTRVRSLIAVSALLAVYG